MADTTCLALHQRTNLTRGRKTAPVQDPRDKPYEFKSYPGLPMEALPPEPSFPAISLPGVLKALVRNRPGGPGGPPLDANVLSGLLRLAYSLTVWSSEPEGGRWHRSAASAGGLYPCELYVAVPDLGEETGAEIGAGLHHYAPGRQGLGRSITQGLPHTLSQALSQGLVMLRSGDAPEYAARLCGFEERPAMVFFVSTVFHRTAWRYGERGYRYALQDAGHLVENLLLALAASGFATELRYNFDDKSVNELLCLDDRREDCLAVVAAYGAASEAADLGDVGLAEELSPVTDLQSLADASIMADLDRILPGLRALHQATVIAAAAVPPSFLSSPLFGPPVGEPRPLRRPSPAPTLQGYPATVLTRRSRRDFLSTDSMNIGVLDALLAMFCAGASSHERSVGVGLLVRAAGDLAPGLYYLDREERTLALVREGEFAGQMADICLEQRFLARAGVQFCLFADMEYVERSLGPRGYRQVLLTAGRLGQRLYLAGGSLGLGCCGVGSFYDTEAATLLGLGDTVRLLYLQAVGSVPG